MTTGAGWVRRWFHRNDDPTRDEPNGEWCMAIDYPPFGTRIESRHFTEKAARAAHEYLHGPGSRCRSGCYVTTVEAAMERNRQIQKAEDERWAVEYEARYGRG